VDDSFISNKDFFQKYSTIHKRDNNLICIWENFFKRNSLEVYEFKGPVKFIPNLLPDFDIFYSFFQDDDIFERYVYPATEYRNTKDFVMQGGYNFHSMRLLSFLNFAYTLQGKTNFDHISICFDQNNNLFPNIGATRCMFTCMINSNMSTNIQGFIFKNKNNKFKKKIKPYLQKIDIDCIISQNYRIEFEGKNAITKNKALICQSNDRDHAIWKEQLWDRHDYMTNFFRKNNKIYSNKDLTHFSCISDYLTTKLSKADVIIIFKKNITEYNDIFAIILALSGTNITSTDFSIINKSTWTNLNTLKN